MAQKQLGFFVIGAMKSGTTSLHHHLSRHPDIFLPREKEAPFFTREDYFSRGMDWYLREFFADAKNGQLLGTVSPQYMAFPGAAKRIHEACPEAKLIAILREPIARARSHYRMTVRTHGETRSFEDALVQQLAPGNLVSARLEPTPLNSYVVWSEYGRVLNEYREFFPREQILIVYSAMLETQPTAVLAQICRFLGIGERFSGAGLDKKYHVNNGHKTLKALVADALHRLPIRGVVKFMLPERYKRRMRVWSTMNRGASTSDEATAVLLSETTSRMLATRLMQDAALLENVIGSEVPWLRMS